MEIGNIIPHIEALIFASDKPLTAMELTELLNNAFGFMDEKLTLEQIQTAVDGIVEKYRSEFYPFEIRESGGGLQFLTKKDYHKTVAQLNGDKFLKRLSTAALETLSIIAYKQPVTKGEIEAIRGVSSDYAIQRLLEKELVVIIGRNEKLPGHPLIYSTSKNFMDYFGINSSEDLPKLKEIFDDAMVNPTAISGQALENEQEASDAATENEQDETDDIEKSGLIVSENGELVIELIEEQNEDTPSDEISEQAADIEEDNDNAEQPAADIADDEENDEEQTDNVETEEEDIDEEENDEEDQDSSNPDDKNRS